MTLKRYNLYMTQHQKHLQRIIEILLTLLMNIILCDALTRFKALNGPTNSFKKIF